jgi:predicted DsbA family dithiol-disulfide isomerase
MMSDLGEYSKLGPRTVLHWYDFLCPYCYVGQTKDAILTRHGLDVIDLPFQAHPDIPPGGVEVGPRTGAMYEMLDREAKEADLPLKWPPRLPDTRIALAAAEWTRQHHPAISVQLNKGLFAAHFALGEDLGDPAVIDRHASELGLDLGPLHAALADGSAEAAVDDAERLGGQLGVSGTPAWIIGGRLLSGLYPAAEFVRLAEYAMRASR